MRQGSGPGGNPNVRTYICAAGFGGLLVFIVCLSLPESSATQIFRWPGPLLLPSALALTGLCIAAVCLGSDRIDLPSHRWWVALVALLGSAFVSMVSNSRFGYGIQALVSVVLATGFFLVSFQAFAPKTRFAGHLGTAVSLAGAVVTLTSLYRWGLYDIPTALGLMDPLNEMAGEELLRFSFAENRNTNPFGHQNYTAGAMLLFIPWHARSVVKGVGRMRMIWAFVLLLDLACLVSTFSRGAWMALIGGALCFVIWLAKKKLVPRKTLMRLTVSLGLLGLLLLAANPRLRTSIGHLVTRGSTQVDQVRANMAAAGWLMIKDNWLIGVGPGNVTTAYPKYRSRLAAGLEDNYQLHITPLQLGVEQGILGLAAWGLLAYVSWISFRQLAQDENATATTAFFTLLTYGLFSLTDYQLDVLPILLLVFLNLSLLAAGDSSVIKTLSPAKNFVGAGTLVITVACLAAQAPDLRGRAIFNSAVDAARAGDAGQFERGAIRAMEMSPSPQYFLNEIAAYHAEHWANSTDPLSKSTWSNSAKNWFTRSLRENPDQEFCHFNLGWILQQDDGLGSARAFVQAARLVPDRKGVYRGLALSLMHVGQTNAALQCLALECLANPTFVASAFWSHAGHVELWPEVYAILSSDLRKAADEVPAGDPGRLRLEQRISFLSWLETGQLEFPGQHDDWTPQMAEFWDTIETDQKMPIRTTAPKAPWKYLHDAWADQGNRKILVTQAVILSTKQIPDDAVVKELVRWVAQEKWSDVVRNVPPPELFRAYNRQRSGFNLLARNLDGDKPTDVCGYVDNHVVELFFEFLYGRNQPVSSLYVLNRLDEIVEGVPGLKEAAGTILVSEQAP